MLAPYLDIDPDKLEVSDSVKAILVLLLNHLEALSKENASLRIENQKLKDEINRLKGEQGKPDFAPKVKPANISSTPITKQSRKHIKKAKKCNIVVHNKVVCTIDPTTLPNDAVFKGYQSLIQQNITFQPNNTEYLKEVYYSPSLLKTFTAETPEYQGYFGGELESFIVMMIFGANMSRSPLLLVLRAMGIDISTGSLENILKKYQSSWEQERNDILRAGLSGSYTQSDVTSACVKGETHRTHVVCSEHFAVYATLAGKSRRDVLAAFQACDKETLNYCYNTVTQSYLAHFRVSKRHQNAICRYFKENELFTEKLLHEKLIKILPDLEKKTTTCNWILDSFAFGNYFTQEDYPLVKVLLSDDAGEYSCIAFNHMLCWIHDARFYNKLNPVTAYHRQTLESFKSRYWKFYELLKEYKENHFIAFKTYILQEFDILFNPTTKYFQLDQEIERTLKNKEKLLTVLDHPEIPLHNNQSELAVRRQVRKRDVSLHTMSHEGTKLQDAFLSIFQTCRLLMINPFEYIRTRIVLLQQALPLPDNYLPTIIQARIAGIKSG